FYYLIGRFSGAFVAAAIAFLSVPLAVFVGGMMPWLDKEAVGPLGLEHYLWGYVVLGLPGLFFSAAAFFALSTVTRSMMATYLGVVLFLVLWFIARTWARQVELDKAAALLEPFGGSAYTLATRYWTTA